MVVVVGSWQRCWQMVEFCSSDTSDTDTDDTPPLHTTQGLIGSPPY